MVDGYHGFEMDTFEFLNILQAHGFPKVIGVLTHLDMFRSTKTLRKKKKALKQRFWTEIYQVSIFVLCSSMVELKRSSFGRDPKLTIAHFFSGQNCDGKKC